MLFAFTSEDSAVPLEENDDSGLTEGSADSPLFRSQENGFQIVELKK